MDGAIIKKINLKAGEEVVSVVRHDVLTLWLRILAAFLLIVLPFFLIFPLFKMGYWGVVIFLFLIALGLAYGLRVFVVWYYNAFIITNQRIIDIDQRGFFERIVSEAPYEKIQDASYRVRGIFGTVFHYGDVRIQTAGATVELEIHNISCPETIQQLIVDLSHLNQRKSRETGADDLSSDLSAPDSEEFKIIKESVNDLDEKQLEELEVMARKKIRAARLKRLEEIKNIEPEK